MTRAWPNAHLIHLPVHASWLDQAEIYFSIIQRKVISPNDFTSLDQIRDRLAAFETRYNAIARLRCVNDLGQFLGLIMQRLRLLRSGSW
jgi:hypothetical protein